MIDSYNNWLNESALNREMTMNEFSKKVKKELWAKFFEGWESVRKVFYQEEKESEDF